MDRFFVVRRKAMSGVMRFEDLIAWQKARSLASDVYRTTRRNSFANDYSLARQIQRAAVSVMSNIAEGFDRASHPEFCQFLLIARASCAEVRSQLYIALDVGYLARNEFDPLMVKVEELGRVIAGLRSSVHARRLRLPKKQGPATPPT